MVKGGGGNRQPHLYTVHTIVTAGVFNTHTYTCIHTHIHTYIYYMATRTHTYILCGYTRTHIHTIWALATHLKKDIFIIVQLQTL